MIKCIDSHYYAYYIHYIFVHISFLSLTRICGLSEYLKSEKRCFLTTPGCMDMSRSHVLRTKRMDSPTNHSIIINSDDTCDR